VKHRTLDYERAVVVDDEAKENEREHHSKGPETCAQKNLTEPTLLEIARYQVLVHLADDRPSANRGPSSDSLS
jgi:hypothetical protein